MAGTEGLDAVFNPGGVAVVGFPTQATSYGAGLLYYANQLSLAGSQRQVYPVNPRGGEINGAKIYPNIKDIPGPVDFVICCIAARFTPQLVRDCADKGVRAIHFFSSGFSEMGTEEGRQLEDEITRIGRERGVRLVGPNCLGVYCPKGKVTFSGDFPQESGHTAFICQTGAQATYFVRLAARHGIRFSKVLSYGNACDVNETDLLEYLTSDPETNLIIMYIEGVKGGARFSHALQKAVEAKPVIVCRGGYSEAGARAASSHTGAMASPVNIWNALMKQAGAITVNSLEEVADIVTAFRYFRLPQGRRIGTVGTGGGAAVLSTDAYSAAGLVLPAFPEDLQNKLAEFISNTAGKIFRNPVDVSGEHTGPALYNVGKAMAGYDGIDTLIFHLPLSVNPNEYACQESVMFACIDEVIRLYRETSKPIAVVVHNIPDTKVMQEAFNCQRRCHEAGIPCYFTMEAAGNALSKFISYHERLKRVK